MKSKIPKIQRHHISSLTFTLNDVRYYWGGGFGAILKTQEKGIKVGEIRVIADVPMIATYIYDPKMFTYNWICGRKDICWSVSEPDTEWINRFKSHLLSV